MNYLVLHDKGAFTGISIEPAGEVYKHAIACWALDDGKKVDYALLQMGRHLNKFYVSGAYQQMALYALTFEELKLILSKRLGPDDETRYSDLLKQESLGYEVEKPFDWNAVIIGTCDFLLKLMWGIVKLMAVVVLIPFVLNFFKNRKHSK